MKKTTRLITIAIMTILMVALAGIATFAASETTVNEGTNLTVSATVPGNVEEVVSSNSKVASIKSETINGNKIRATIEAKTAGKAKIMAEVNGTEKEICIITVNHIPATKANTAAAYTQLNNYRKAALTKSAKATYNKEVKKANKMKKAKKAKALKAAKAKYNKSVNSVTLKRDANLEKIALQRAKEMAETGKFSHTRPNGKSGLTLIPGNKAKGENIAMGQKTCAQVSKAWYASPGHRANMLRKNFTKVGIAGYTYQGTTYWAQVFSN